MLAGTGAEKKNQTWAPLPERDLSTAAGRPTPRHVSTNALTSSVHVPASKSTARNQQVSSSRRGYTPITWRPVRCPTTAASSNGRKAWFAQSLHLPPVLSAQSPGSHLFEHAGA